MLTVHCYDGAEARVIENPDDISELVAQSSRLVWVDLVHPTDSEYLCVQAEFDLHPLAMEDARKHGQRPKLEEYPTHAFMVAYSAALAEVDLFIGPNWLVTVRGTVGNEAWSVDAARTRFERTHGDNGAVGFLVYTILDELVDGYFTAMDAYEDRLEAVEEAIFSEVAARDADERGIQEQLFDFRREMLVFRRRVAPLREVLAGMLRQEVQWLDRASLVHLQDVYDHVLRVLDLVDGQRELMGNAVDAHLAIISNHMNDVMKRMTSWGAILLGSTLVAGIYGMNFRHMPELDWELGYPFALALMATITITGYLFFRRRDWL